MAKKGPETKEPKVKAPKKEKKPVVPPAGAGVTEPPKDEGEEAAQVSVIDFVQSSLQIVSFRIKELKGGEFKTNRELDQALLSCEEALIQAKRWATFANHAIEVQKLECPKI